jgi:D-alanyl-D-alanine carboxypeptidase
MAGPLGWCPVASGRTPGRGSRGPTIGAALWRLGPRWLFSVVLVAGPVVSAEKAAAQAGYPAPPTAVTKTVLSYLDSPGVLEGGLSAEVSQGVKVEWAGGFGLADIADKAPATAQTVYQIGSITKTFTAALVMQLVQAHKLGLSDHLGQFVPGLPYGQKVTIAELLDHTSGIPDYLNSRPSLLGADCPSPSGSAAKCPPLSPAQVVRWLAARPLEFSPGTQFSYSDSNFYLLGLVIERVTGQAYSPYLAAHVLRPLGLSHTGPCPPAMHPPAQAQGYADSIGLGIPEAFGNVPTDSEAFSAGELFSTAGDLTRWANDLGSGRVVAPGTYKKMATPAPLPGGVSAPYGHGLVLSPVDGQPSVGHDGGTPGFSSVVFHLPGPDLNIAVCFNTGNAVVAKLVESAIVEAVLTGKPDPLT